MHPLLDPRHPHLFLRLFVPLGAVLLMVDMALGNPLGGIPGWGWAYFTVLIAVSVSPYLALPFLVASLTLVLGSRITTTSAAGDDPAIAPGTMAVILSVCALWFVTALVLHLVRIDAREEAENADAHEDAPADARK